MGNPFAHPALPTVGKFLRFKPVSDLVSWVEVQEN